MTQPVPDYRSWLVPDRSCGACVACCVAPSIDAGSFYKPVGVACRHCLPAQGCGIYESRPAVCRDYHCVWRSMPALDESWRPDRSGVMIAWDTDAPVGTHAVKIVLTGDRSVIGTDRFLQLVSGFVARGVSTMLSLPREPGHLNIGFRVNDLLASAVRAGDRAAVRAILADTCAGAENQPLVADTPPDQ